MYRLSSRHFVTTMSAEHSPAAVMESGDTILVETLDCFGNRFYREGGVEGEPAADNPATGPICIRQAERGDTLKVDILNINISSQAVIEQIAGKGCLGKMVQEDAFKIVPVEQGHVRLGELEIAVRPMIGVIGTATPECTSTLTPGPHGGNMDCSNITEGSTVYLPVLEDGGYLALGDLHAVMADGEIGYSGAEVYGSVLLRVTVLKHVCLESPVVKEGDCYYFIASADSLDEAAEKASLHLADYLTRCEGMTASDAVMALNLIGSLGICQAVNPQKTVKLQIHESWFRRPFPAAEKSRIAACFVSG